MNLSRSFIWRKLRERIILARHRQVASICEQLIAKQNTTPEHYCFSPKATFDSEKIIWQYWGQGVEKAPDIVQRCFASVNYYCPDYTIIRLTDGNLSNYLDLPEFVVNKRQKFSKAHFADILRLMLLSTYGGVWMDATIMMTGPIPEDWAKQDFFVFRRDPNEPNFRYWRNTYAYYFGWAKGFRVNMLNSFIITRKGNRTVKDLCDLMLRWWKEHDSLPDYFFFQILYDVYGTKDVFPLVSDTLPHYLQQSISDPTFSLMSQDRIKHVFPLHKLTYKNG